nr:MAG TPA: hypothetical protein [Caudoviricetes sp.]
MKNFQDKYRKSESTWLPLFFFRAFSISYNEKEELLC